jgi:hypothetical protein
MTPSTSNWSSHERHLVVGDMSDAPIPMLLWCPECRARHVDVGEFATKPHHTHACQGCGHVWRPALVATAGVQFLPGFKNDEVPEHLHEVDGHPSTLLHRLWTKAAGTPGYVKAQWIALERHLAAGKP